MRPCTVDRLIVAAVLFVGMAATVTAEDKVKVETNQEILEHAIAEKARAEAELATDPLFSVERNAVLSKQHEAEARDIAKASEPKLQESLDAMIAGDEKVQKILEANAQQEGAEPVVNARYRLFVSRGQGEAAFKAIIEVAKQHPDMVLVLRGLLPGEKMTDLAQFLGRVMTPKEGEPVANIMLDPPSFQDRKVAVVPTLEVLDPTSGDVIASARGVVNPTWIEERVARGDRGDLGAFGATAEIAEEDMIVAMKRQAAEWDGEAYGKKVAESVWDQLEMVSLPTATTTIVREVDPTVIINEAVTAPDGTVIAYPGQRVNPFDVMPFDMTLVIIDARDPDQVAFAKRKVLELDGKQVTVIATEVPRDVGWKGLGDTINGVGRMVYLLQPEMIERFGIRAVPCTVEGGNRVLVVREYARADYTKGAGDADRRSKEG